MNLGDIIREFREDHHLSQRQFALLTGLSNGYISMIENGENPKTKKPISPTIDQLKKLSIGLGISLQELFTRADDIPVNMATENQSVDQNEMQLLVYYNRLNEEGQEILLELADNMVRSGKYIKNNSAQVV